MSILRRITARADLTDPCEAQYITMALVAHDGLLRAGELLRLRLSDVVTWHSDHVTLRVRESKANKVSGRPEFVRIYASDWRLCGFTALRAYWLRMRMDSGYHRDYLFPSSSPSAPMPKETWVRYIASHLEALGFNPASYSGHSFRSGGATDLWQGNCRPRVIQLYGRWLSDAFWLYVRDNPHAGAREVAHAFSALARQSRQNSR
jgi:integrase